MVGGYGQSKLFSSIAFFPGVQIFPYKVITSQSKVLHLLSQRDRERDPSSHTLPTYLLVRKSNWISLLHVPTYLVLQKGLGVLVVVPSLLALTYVHT